MRGGLDDHGATGSERGPCFARDHGQRKIPGSDASDHANRLFENHDALVGLMTGNGVAVDPFRFFTKPFKKRSGISYFTARFGERFALLQGHQAREIILIFDHQVEPLAENDGALFCGFGAPGFEGLIGGFDGAAGFRAGEFWNFAEDFAGGRIIHVERGAAGGTGSTGRRRSWLRGTGACL